MGSATIYLTELHLMERGMNLPHYFVCIAGTRAKVSPSSGTKQVKVDIERAGLFAEMGKVCINK